jgi:hypothetical protein
MLLINNEKSQREINMMCKKLELQWYETNLEQSVLSGCPSVKNYAIKTILFINVYLHKAQYLLRS